MFPENSLQWVSDTGTDFVHQQSRFPELSARESGWVMGFLPGLGLGAEPDVSRGPYGATKSGWRTLISPRSVHEERQAELMQKPESTPARKSECAYIELA